MSLTLTLERGGGEVSGSGTNIELNGTIAGGAIESVEMYGDTEQTMYTGKNLAKFNDSYTANGITTTLNSDGSLTCSGTTTTTYFNTLPYQATLPSVLPAGTYTFSRGGDTTYAVQIQVWDSTKNQTLTFRIPAGQTSITDTTTFDAYYYGSSFVYLSANVQINTTVKLQLELGSTATSFEPYVGGTASPNPDYPQEVKVVTGLQTITISDGGSQSVTKTVNLGKNLATLADGTGTRGNNTATTSDQTVTINSANNTGTETTWYLNDVSQVSQWASNYSNARDYNMTGMGGAYAYTYYLENIPSGNGALQFFLCTNKRSIVNGRGDLSDNKITSTITLDDDEYIKSVQLYVAAVNVFDNFKVRWQIEKGSTATTYAPYFTPIELCKIGTYQDYIYKSGDDWYIHKAIRRYNFTGSEPISVYQNNVADLTSVFNLTPFVVQGGGVCNRAKYNPVQVSVSTTIELGEFALQFSYNTYNFFLKLPGNSYTSEQAQQWFVDNPTTVYYPLANPTDTQITNSALIAQLDALNSAQTYDGETVITVDSENLAGSLEVTASSTITKTYTEVEIGSPFTIADVEGKSSNTTLDGNVYVDWAYNKKQYSFDLFNLTPQDYADIRAFYDYQFNNSAFPTITVPELNIDKLPVYMEISSRNIINQCLLTDKLTIKFRETVQP